MQACTPNSYNRFEVSSSSSRDECDRKSEEFKKQLCHHQQMLCMGKRRASEEVEEGITTEDIITALSETTTNQQQQQPFTPPPRRRDRQLKIPNWGRESVQQPRPLSPSPEKPAQPSRIKQNDLADSSDTVLLAVQHLFDEENEMRPRSEMVFGENMIRLVNTILTLGYSNGAFRSQSTSYDSLVAITFMASRGGGDIYSRVVDFIVSLTKHKPFYYANEITAQLMASFLLSRHKDCSMVVLFDEDNPQEMRNYYAAVHSAALGFRNTLLEIIKQAKSVTVKNKNS